MGEGLTGWEWLSRFMWPYAGEITPDETAAAIYVGAVEAVLSGTTSVLDHHYGRTDPDTTLRVASILEEVGLRGIVARGIAGPHTELARRQGLPESAFPYTADAELEMMAACLTDWPSDSRISMWAGPINTVYTDQELLAASVALAREHGAGWHTHLSAPRSDPDIYLEAYGMRPADWLHSRGLLGPDTVLAHATWIDESEIAALGSTQTGIAHCPLSNFYVPYGVMRYRELVDAGAVIGLGSDGSACGHRQDLFENMKLMVLMHRIDAMAPGAITAEEALEVGTRGGAAVHGIDAGQISEGRLADVLVLNGESPHLAPLHKPGPGVVYSAGAADVVMSIIGGEVVVEDGRVATVDQDEVIKEARGRAAELGARIGL